MKKTITPINGTDLIKIHLEEGLARSADRVSQLAKRLLTQDQVRADVAGGNPDLLELLDRGALTLTLLAQTTECPLVVDPLFLFDGHTAACLVAGRATPTNYEKEDVLEILGFLAGLLPILTVGMRLPPWNEVHSDSKGLGRGRDIYNDLRSQDVSVTGLRRITLGDALVLRECLRLRSHPSILKLWKDLDRVTATHRHALSRLVGRAE
jgi:hypothetical protein